MAAAVLALLTAAVVTGSAAGVDDVVARAVAAHRPPALVAAARALTRLGGAPVLVPLTLVAGLVAGLVGRGVRARPGRWRPLAALSLAGGGAWASMAVMKEVVARPRPDDALVAAGGWAFPSGHAAASAAWWLTAALVAAAWVPSRARPALLVAGAVLALAVGTTRVVLGVHHATDVVGGWALGALWALAAARLRAGPDRPPAAAP